MTHPPSPRLAPLALALGRALVLAGCGAEPAPGPAPLSLLLVTLDTTRADALGCYGNARGLTPNLDALAAESLVYDRAHSVAPITLPAHASLMTGLYPLRHAVRENGLWPLPDEALTLAELAAERGHQTGAIVASAVLDASFGLAQGFASYQGSTLEQKTTVYTSLPARSVVDAALRWLAARERARPFFLWVHLYDPHAPYEPPEELRRGLEGLELYFGEIASVDRELGRLFAGLRADGALATTFVALTADHGEALGEHGELTHGAYCFQTTLRVPLLLRYPDGYRAGERDDALVSLVDLYPTLLEAIGARVPADVDGQSLWRTTPAGDRGLYFESYMGWLAFGWSQLAGWLDERGKYLHSSEPQLFDLARDPDELQDLAPRADADLEPYRRALAALAARPALLAQRSDELDPELLAELRSLGYAAAGSRAVDVPAPLQATERASPLRMLPQYNLLLHATGLMDVGRMEEAVPILASALAASPHNHFAREQLSAALLRLNRAREALPHLERLAAEAPPRSLNFQNQASALSALGRNDEAIAALEHALALNPRNEAALRGLVRILQRVGRASEAQPWRARLDELERSR